MHVMRKNSNTRYSHSIWNVKFIPKDINKLRDRSHYFIPKKLRIGEYLAHRDTPHNPLSLPTESSGKKFLSGHSDICVWSELQGA